MAKKSNAGPAPQSGGAEAPKKKKMTPRQLAVTAAAILVVLVAVVIIDNNIRNPLVEDSTAAINVAIDKVLHVMTEMDDDDVFSIECLDLQKIEGKSYYPVVFYVHENYETPQEKEVPVLTVYIQESSSKVFRMNDQGQLIPYTPKAA